MAARSKKERQKLQKRRRDRQREKTNQPAAQPASRPLELPSRGDVKLRADAGSPARSSPTPAPETTPIDRWWDEFTAAEGDAQVRMVREKLESVAPGDPWFESLFPEAIFELENKLSEREYVEFLEDLRATWPDVFAEGAEWHAHNFAFYYIAQQRSQDLDLAIKHFADGLGEVDDPFFSLTSIIRLAGRQEAAQRLVDAALALEPLDDLTPSGASQLMAWAMFAPYQACVRAGCTDEAIDALHDYVLKIVADDSEELRQTRRDFALHLAGQADPWDREVLLKDDRHTGRRFYLLGVDFMRWLCVSRAFEPVVADELRHILIDLVGIMESRPSELLRSLRRQDFEPALAAKLGFLSLNRIHAPAGVVAMRLFYDFLAESELIDERLQNSVRKLTDVLWKDVKRSLSKDWQHYEFLERYLRPTGS